MIKDILFDVLSEEELEWEDKINYDNNKFKRLLPFKKNYDYSRASWKRGNR